MQERILTGRIARLGVWTLPELGTRASFTIEGTGQPSVFCAVEGDVAREFITHYCEGDIVAVRGFFTNLNHQPPPPIRHGPADFARPPCGLRKTSVSWHEGTLRFIRPEYRALLLTAILLLGHQPLNQFATSRSADQA
jgi:hypothetical protein